MIEIKDVYENVMNEDKSVAYTRFLSSAQNVVRLRQNYETLNEGCVGGKTGHMRDRDINPAGQERFRDTIEDDIMRAVQLCIREYEKMLKKCRECRTSGSKFYGIPQKKHNPDAYYNCNVIALFLHFLYTSYLYWCGTFNDSCNASNVANACGIAVTEGVKNV
uniref:Uncharacterized protein n=1 Tax=Glossina austeni TaxID=7395 RepID=A0A1A9V437_GLOAU